MYVPDTPCAAFGLCASERVGGCESGLLNLNIPRASSSFPLN